MFNRYFEDEEKCSVCGNPMSECACGKDDE